MLSQYPLFWSQVPLWKHQTCQMSKYFIDAFPISICLSLNNCGLAKFHQGNLEQWGTTPKYTLQGETVNKSLSTFHITGTISIVLRGEANQVICICSEPWSLLSKLERKPHSLNWDHDHLLNSFPVVIKALLSEAAAWTYPVWDRVARASLKPSCFLKSIFYSVLSGFSHIFDDTWKALLKWNVFVCVRVTQIASLPCQEIPISGKRCPHKVPHSRKEKPHCHTGLPED